MGEGDGYKGTWEDGLAAPFSEDIHGRYLLRYVLEQYRLGYKRSFIYELLDSDQPQWGLLQPQGLQKFNLLQILITLPTFVIVKFPNTKVFVTCVMVVSCVHG
jgi:hypothetical protein